MNCDKGVSEIVEVLITNGASLNATDYNGWTALMKAVYRGHVETVEILLENKADVTVKNIGGNTALVIAETMVRPEIIRELQEAGAQK